MRCSPKSETKMGKLFKEERFRAHAYKTEEKAFTIRTAVSLKHVKLCDIVLCLVKSMVR